MHSNMPCLRIPVVHHVTVQYSSFIKGWCGCSRPLKYQTSVHWYRVDNANTYAVIGQKRPLQSNESMYAISSGLISKSKMLKFSWILDFVTDLGIVTTPRWIWYLSKTWATLLPYFSASCLRLGSTSNWGSLGFAHGLSGEPRGL